MNKSEAQLLLQACRPDSRDLSRPELAEALALVEHDPELKAWWKAQQEFDRKVSARLREIPVPAELRAKLLAERKVVPFPSAFRFSNWLAAAAAIGILLVLNPWHGPSSGTASPIAGNEYAAAVLPMLRNDNPDLAMLSPDHEKVMAWLKQQNSPTGTLPSSMTHMPSVGCQTFSVHGHSVSLICFALASGKIVHLFTIDKSAMANPPPDFAPQFGQSGEWATATWSDGTKSYILATRAGPDTLKRLL